MRTLISSSAAVAIALTTAAPAAVAQAPRQDQPAQNRICMIVGNEGQARCAWQSLASCERAARGGGGRCYDRTYMLAATPPPPDTAVAPEPRVPRRHHIRHHE